jgi:hypothetical protein
VSALQHQAAFDGFKEHLSSDVKTLKWIFGIAVTCIAGIVGAQWLTIQNVSNEVRDLASEVTYLLFPTPNNVS